MPRSTTAGRRGSGGRRRRGRPRFDMTAARYARLFRRGIGVDMTRPIFHRGTVKDRVPDIFGGFSPIGSQLASSGRWQGSVRIGTGRELADRQGSTGGAMRFVIGAPAIAASDVPGEALLHHPSKSRPGWMRPRRPNDGQRRPGTSFAGGPVCSQLVARSDDTRARYRSWQPLFVAIGISFGAKSEEKSLSMHVEPCRGRADRAGRGLAQGRRLTRGSGCPAPGPPARRSCGGRLRCPRAWPRRRPGEARQDRGRRRHSGRRSAGSHNRRPA